MNTQAIGALLGIVSNFNGGRDVPHNLIHGEWWRRARLGLDGCEPCQNQLGRAIYWSVRSGALIQDGYGAGMTLTLSNQPTRQP